MKLTWPVRLGLLAVAAFVLLALYGPLLLTVFFSFFTLRRGAVQWDSFGFDWYAKLFFGYNVAPTGEQLAEAFRQGDVRAGIQDNQIGMWAGMLSERGGKPEGTPWTMRWGVVPLPRDREPAALTLIDGYYISARTQYPDACWKWISFLSQQMPGRQIPARKSLVESTEYKQKVGDDVAAATKASMEKALLLSPMLAQFEEVFTSFNTAFQAIMAQQSTPEEAMTTAQPESKLK